MKKLFFATILYSYLFTLPAMSQTLTEIYETIPDTIIPKNIGDATEVTQNSDSLILFNKGNAKYELAKIADSKVVLLITLPLPEPDTRAYLFNIYNSDSEPANKLRWQLESSRDISNGEFKFAEATITSVSPLLIQVTLREPFIPKDEKNEPIVLKNIKLF